MSIYRYERRVWLALNGKVGIKSLEEIQPVNKKKLLEYADYLKASGKSLPRQDKLLRTIKIFATWLGPIPFKKATKKDVVNALAKYVEHLTRTEAGGGSPHTTSDFQKIVKQFYAWSMTSRILDMEGIQKRSAGSGSKSPNQLSKHQTCWIPATSRN